ncbi:unnamed protein product [Sphagnum jensenii]|uniref:Uncharacterized protein n=1 Tax=Sphagnum jensenii TaxID=128206 RepID=A0ABP0W0Y6_9BRYO
MWVVINCVLVKQSSEIPISKIHEATRYSASLKLTLCLRLLQKSLGFDVLEQIWLWRKEFGFAVLSRYTIVNCCYSMVCS